MGLKGDLPLLQGDALLSLTNIGAEWSYDADPGTGSEPGVATDLRARLVLYGVNAAGETKIGTIIFPRNTGTFVARQRVTGVFSSPIDGNFLSVKYEVQNYNSNEGTGWNASTRGFNLFKLYPVVNKMPIDTAIGNAETSLLMT